MPCPENCSCYNCLEREFRDSTDLAALYLKVRKHIQATEDAWIKQDKAREIRRKLKRDSLDTLIRRIDLESKRRMSSSSTSDTFSI